MARAQRRIGTPGLSFWRDLSQIFLRYKYLLEASKAIAPVQVDGRNVATMPLMRQAAPLTMAWCLDCHRNPAPNLRVAADVFDPAWQPPHDQDQRGATLAHQNIDNAHLTDCSVCHR